MLFVVSCMKNVYHLFIWNSILDILFLVRVPNFNLSEAGAPLLIKYADGWYLLTVLFSTKLRSCETRVSHMQLHWQLWTCLTLLGPSLLQCCQTLSGPLPPIFNDVLLNVKMGRNSDPGGAASGSRGHGARVVRRGPRAPSRDFKSIRFEWGSDNVRHEGWGRTRSVAGAQRSAQQYNTPSQRSASASECTEVRVLPNHKREPGWAGARHALYAARTLSRGGKRQIAHSTVKSMGNFLAPEPWQFGSDFLFGQNHKEIHCYFELNILKNISNRAMIYFNFGA